MIPECAPLVDLVGGTYIDGHTCDTVLGWAWDGSKCYPLTGCACYGTDCARLVVDELACIVDHASHCQSTP